ncbi:paired amphipathic helix [Vararia minispora EC-137]|uniref:Paired amphipathic helix n=1 Tax=Vararia minispora EC-137 TaxID=1314806 RepID=A0ACB8QIY4_9AGAM|nr:paired amphipathic helix [Vararia minispora EC-137]
MHADFEKALNFVQTVKARAPETYDAFLKLLQDYRSDVIGMSEVRDRVVELFKNYPDLIEGFDVYLPRPSESTLCKQPTLETRDGSAYDSDFAAVV